MALIGTVAACSQRPPAGVLPRAPAGMQITGPCTPEADGSLNMPAGCTANGTAYVDRGPVTITVAATAVGAATAALEVWFDARRIATLTVAASSSSQALS